MKTIDKIAFLVHEPVMYIHYAPVWAQLKREDFVIVLCGRCELGEAAATLGVQGLIEQIKEHAYEVDFFSDIVRRSIKYRYVISNHYVGGRSFGALSRKNRIGRQIRNDFRRVRNFTRALFGGKPKFALSVIDPVQYFPLQIGIKQIRFMYGADISDGWSLASWNELYDLFLCHGPNDSIELQKRFHGKTEIMGYPRYDDYFNKNLNVTEVTKEFNIDTNKKTILWMPTTGDGVCSLPEFALPISGLMEKFNIIVRPHPISFRADPEYIELLRSLNYKIDSNPLRDMNKLYRLVDVVLCDYGGSAFGAIYLDKNLILLDVKGSNNSDDDANSSNLELTDYFPVLSPEDSCNIEQLVEDEKLWQEQKHKREMLFNKFFADNRGESSRKAAEILGSLETILN